MDVLGRLVYEYNHTWDEWQQKGQVYSLTRAIQPVMQEAALDLLRTAGLTICQPSILGMRQQHMTAAIVRTLGAVPGRIESMSQVNWDPVLATLRSLDSVR
jgi:hypothetical protein